MDSKILEQLLKLKNVYRDETEAKVGADLVVKMRILSSEEETEAHSSALQYDKGLPFLFSVKRETICRAIFNLNGQDIPDFIETIDASLERSKWLKDNVIKGWSQYLVDKVWTKYNEMALALENKISDVVVEEKLEKTQEPKDEAINE